MRDERLKRLDETEFLERSRAQIGQNPPVLALSSPTWASIALAAARAAGWSPIVFASTAALARKAKR